MTWREFCLRSYGYKRQEEKEWQRARFVAFNALTGFHRNPKKLPKNVFNLLPLSSDPKKKQNPAWEKYTKLVKEFKEKHAKK